MATLQFVSSILVGQGIEPCPQPSATLGYHLINDRHSAFIIPSSEVYSLDAFNVILQDILANKLIGVTSPQQCTSLSVVKTLTFICKTVSRIRIRLIQSFCPHPCSNHTIGSPSGLLRHSSVPDRMQIGVPSAGDNPASATAAIPRLSVQGL